MPAYYSIVQYVPDDVLNERINIGVLVYGAGRTLTHFLNTWSRVRDFAPIDVVAELREFSRAAKRMNEEAIRRAADRWTNGIQITAPAGSLLSDEALLYDAASRFLVDPPQAAQRGYKVKSDVAKLARKRVREALIDRFGGKGQILLKGDDYAIAGDYAPHPFDLTVANGHPYFAVQAVSFQVPDFKKIDTAVSAAAWAIKDVLRASPKFPMAVAVAEPKTIANQPSFEQAKRAFDDMGVPMIPEDQLDTWSHKITADIPAPANY